MQAGIHASIFDIQQDAWNYLLEPGNPFCDWRFLAAFESAGLVGPGTAWEPQHITIAHNGQLVAAAPFYKKHDSYGEFIFDWGWAQAYDQAGLAYYPKGLCAVPYTPATGLRLLTAAQAPQQQLETALLAVMRQIMVTQRLSSLHILFCSQTQQERLIAAGLLPRLSLQFHWQNRNYASFEDFLADLRAAKRKQIKKERQALKEAGIEVVLLQGNDISLEHIDAMYNFYLATQSGKWRSAYLNRAWFEIIHATYRDNVVMTMARRSGRWLGGAINFRKGNHLYGRYWGALEHIDFLHFECCYYSLIEFAIAEKIKLYEAGAQGEHKFLRGFAARPTYSAHDFVDTNGRRAIADFLRRESRHVEQTINAYNQQSPLKHVRQQAQAVLLPAKQGRPGKPHSS